MAIISFYFSVVAISKDSFTLVCTCVLVGDIPDFTSFLCFCGYASVSTIRKYRINFLALSGMKLAQCLL